MLQPSFPQEQYAKGLVERMREASLFEAGSYARKVLFCTSRAEMSMLIEQMQKVLREADEEFGHWA